MFASLTCYKRHFKKIHSDIKLEKAECETCGKKISREKLGTHMKIHGTEFKCKYCNHKAQSNANLKAHLRSVHDDPGLKSHKEQCKICKKEISVKHLQEHEDAVHNKIKIPCYICNKLFTRKSHLNEHLKAIHHNSEYKCDSCDLKYSRLGDLHTHKKAIHENIFYSCDSCEFKCNRKSSLSEHKKRQHEGILWDCDSCDYGQVSRGALGQHKRSVHQGIRFKCTLCQREFTKNCHLKSHISRIHTSKTNS